MLSTITENHLFEIFSSVNSKEIPQINQEEYLVDGKFKHWNGPFKEVNAAICKPTTDVKLERISIGKIPKTGLPEALECLESSENAYDNGFGEWPMFSVEQRIFHVEKFVGEMINLRSEVVNLLMWEIGKSEKDSEKEFDRTIKYIYDTIESLKKLERKSASFTIEEGVIGQVRRSPLGVTLCIGPYNYPLNETYTLLIPALIMGNVILFKPPKHGCLLHFSLSKAIQKSFPKGVINYLYGKGNEIIEPLMNTGKINVLTLIGSSKVASDIKKAHPKVNRLRAILGLDAKNPAIVLENANLENAVEECILGSLSFNGQRCTALKILFVHENIKDEFLKKFCEKVDALKFGMPWDEKVQITPLPEEDKFKYLNDCISDAEAKGGKIMNENGAIQNGSLFFPAVVYPVKDGMKLYREEQFGPIVPIVSFTDMQEPIDYMISSNYGQQVSIFGTDTKQISHLLDGLVNQVSRVNINVQCQRGPDTFPFTGRKDSAEGTLSVYDALRSFSIRTVVATKETMENKAIINKIVSEDESSFLSTKFIF
ncbi:NADP-dependent glyceraldehyde-3-phosphate dehydrogenase [Halpernia frigidisoli]|uniref:Acyl-CoA reductase n=1 Tax=Halpernia frigidisoli TaxID=1125876 RepID=A0A1I3DBZ5_9FLAO|nr:NADP-dependent glyceraldehyde-3-phosphate dehydrogenase [Halpernia frigidisoli]SFH84237.1 Acyl-CoA reductase [Halpernia frigidisoli]